MINPYFSDRGTFWGYLEIIFGVVLGWFGDDFRMGFGVIEGARGIRILGLL